MGIIQFLFPFQIVVVFAVSDSTQKNYELLWSVLANRRKSAINEGKQCQ